MKVPGVSTLRMLVSVDFEVFGRVQGVFFRANTQDTALKHGLVGWVKNTYQETVKGQVQGPQQEVNIMKVWLEKEGSPMSKIDRCVFTNERSIDSVEYKSFSVRH